MKHRALIIGILFAVAMLDSVLKYFAIISFPSENDPTLSPILALVLHKNPGITFDLPIPFWVIAPVTIMIILGLIHQARSLSPTQPRVVLGIIAVIIGAVDNFIDRVINGFTTDYLMFFKTSVINLADVIIVLGAIMIVVYYTNNPHQQRA
mgnify:FL=1